MTKPPTSANGNHRFLIFFILAWVILNLIQAGFTKLDGDEAYYWMYSRHLAWGYFDHPPMVAISVRFGELFAHGSLFTRLGTVLFSAGSLFFGYHALPQKFRNLKFYLLSFSSVILFHVYGFIVTPDSSLLFFTALFFYAYRLYLEKAAPIHVLFLALSIAGLLYSKYHGVLPVLFVFLSNPRLVFRSSAWLVVLVVLLLFLPHLAWQVQHDLPTFRYHLSERIGSPYRLDKTTNYILSQLLVWGPLTTVPALYQFLKKRKADQYLRAHYFNFFGIWIFFFFNSFRSTIEPHWTLASGISFITLWVVVLQNASEKFTKTMVRLMFINISLLLIMRVVFALPDSPFRNVLAFKTQMFGKDLTDSVYSKASGTPVVFLDSYTLPSLYLYYHRGQQSTGYSTVYSRKNYFSLSADGSELNNREVFIAAQYRISNTDIEIPNGFATIYLHKMDSFRAINNLRIEWDQGPVKGKAGKKIATSVLMINGNETIHANDLSISYAFIKTKKMVILGENPLSIGERLIVPGDKRSMQINLVLPIEPGKYKLVFSIVQPPLAGTIASPYYEFDVE